MFELYETTIIFTTRKIESFLLEVEVNYHNSRPLAQLGMRKAALADLKRKRWVCFLCFI